MMKTPTLIKSNGSATLWSWGNYRYTIDAEGVKDKMIFENCDLEYAIEAFDINYSNQ
jgi:hypothetical protein